MFRDGTFTTSDMALAALLRGQGLSYEIVKKGDAEVVWRFSCNQHEPLMRDVVARYKKGETRVEPRAFVRHFTTTRTEMYRVLGKEPPPRPVRVVT